MRRMLAVVTAVLLLGLALPVLATAQDTCPEGDGWVKVDGLDGQSYTYDVPEGFEVTSNCFKAGNELVFGSGPTVENTTVFNQNGKLRDISHASFLLVEIEEEEEETTTTSEPEETTTTEPEETTTTEPAVTPTPDVVDDEPQVDEEEATTTTVAPVTSQDPTTTTEAEVELTQLPFTGSEDLPLAFAALALIGAGWMLTRGFRAED